MSARTLVMSLAGLALVGIEGAPAQEYRTTSASRQYRGEDDLRVLVEFGVGRFRLGPGPDALLYRMNLRYDARAFDPVTEYDAARRRLRVGVEGRNLRGDRINYPERPEQQLELQLSPSVPASLDLFFGAGTAEVDLGGLSLRGAEIKGGASESIVRFSTPNRIACDRLSFEVGAIDLKVTQLGNARCSRIELKGAAGSLTLDFTGEWPENAATQVAIAVGLGAVRLRVPEELGVEVSVERFLTSFDRSGLRRRGDRYYSANYEGASAKLLLDIKAAIGSVEIEWVR